MKSRHDFQFNVEFGWREKTDGEKSEFWRWEMERRWRQKETDRDRESVVRDDADAIYSVNSRLYFSVFLPEWGASFCSPPISCPPPPSCPPCDESEWVGESNPQNFEQNWDIIAVFTPGWRDVSHGICSPFFPPHLWLGCRWAWGGAEGPSIPPAGTRAYLQVSPPASPAISLSEQAAPSAPATHLLLRRRRGGGGKSPGCWLHGDVRQVRPVAGGGCGRVLAPVRS